MSSDKVNPVELLNSLPDDEETMAALEKILKEKKKKFKKDKLKKVPIEKADEDDPKYLITLKLINTILEKNKASVVPKLDDVRELYRDYLLRENISNIIDDLMPEILIVFTKQDIGYTRKDTTQIYILTLIKTMLKNIGYKLTAKVKRTQKNNYTQTHCYYMIA